MKKIVTLDHFPRDRDEKRNTWKPPPRKWNIEIWENLALTPLPPMLAIWSPSHQYIFQLILNIYWLSWSPIIIYNLYFTNFVPQRFPSVSHFSPNHFHVLLKLLLNNVPTPRILFPKKKPTKNPTATSRTFFRHVVVVMMRRCHHHRSLVARRGNYQRYGESWSVRHLGKCEFSGTNSGGEFVRFIWGIREWYV